MQEAVDELIFTKNKGTDALDAEMAINTCARKLILRSEGVGLHGNGKQGNNEYCSHGPQMQRYHSGENLLLRHQPDVRPLGRPGTGCRSLITQALATKGNVVEFLTQDI